MSLGGGFLFLKRQEVGDRLTHTVHDKATSKKMYLKHIQYVEFFFFLKSCLSSSLHTSISIHCHLWKILSIKELQYKEKSAHWTNLQAIFPSMRLLQSSASSRDDLKRRNQELDLRPPSLWNGPVATAKTNSTPPFHCPSTHTPRGTCPIQQAKGLTSFEVMPGSSLLPYRASSSSFFYTSSSQARKATSFEH